MPRRAVLALVALVVSACASGHPVTYRTSVPFTVVMTDQRVATGGFFVRGTPPRTPVTATRADGTRVVRTTVAFVAHFHLEPGRYTFSAPKCAAQTFTVSRTQNGGGLRCRDLVPHVP